jgi:hypothetical protein
MRHVLLIATVVPLFTLTGCGGPTAPSFVELQQDSARWASHHLTKYAYDFETTGFFNNLTGQVIHLVVLDDTVRSAVFVATGDTVPVPAAGFSTVNGLFDRAFAALNAGTLAGIQIDSMLSYPRRIDITGPPDAGGSIVASNLQPLP